jgi:putative addiction module component (TIGR02574 family)
MGPAAEQVLHAALALPESERLELIEAILAADDQDCLHPDWIDEVRRRSAEIDTGAVTLSPWSGVRSRVRQKLEATIR